MSRHKSKETTEATDQARREADLVRNRIEELRESSIIGDFDLKHLKAVHAYIFQDLPHHRPGVTRANTKHWTKRRALEDKPDRYDVPYVSQDVAKHISKILRHFGGPASLIGLASDDAARRLAKLYGDLDYGHAFYEGNSRTLREFTRTLAAAAGFSLDWIGSGVGAKERNALYLARDLAVYERVFPGLNEARAMSTEDKREYEAFFTVERLQNAVGATTLEAIVRSRLRKLNGVGQEADASASFPDLLSAA
jgi:cell filamentation protein